MTTTASAAVRKALALAGSSTASIASILSDEQIAGLTDEQRAELAAKLGAAAAPAAPTPPANAAHPEPDSVEPDGDPDDSKCSKCGGPMNKGKCAKCAPDSSADAGAEARDPRVAAVAAAVATDDACKGKADMALAMLADPDFNDLSASAMVKVLARAPATEANGDAADGKAMLELMRQGASVNLGNDGAAKPAAEENHGWAKIHEELRARNAR